MPTKRKSARNLLLAASAPIKRSTSITSNWPYAKHGRMQFLRLPNSNQIHINSSSLTDQRRHGYWRMTRGHVMILYLPSNPGLDSWRPLIVLNGLFLSGCTCAACPRSASPRKSALALQIFFQPGRKDRPESTLIPVRDSSASEQ